jgi:hypothetical protein
MGTFIAIWLAFGLLAVVIAARKDLNIVAWIFLGAFFGIFAVILVLFQAAGQSKSGAWSAGNDGTGGGGGGAGCGGAGCGGGGCGGGCGGGGS